MRRPPAGHLRKLWYLADEVARHHRQGDPGGTVRQLEFLAAHCRLFAEGLMEGAPAETKGGD